MSEKSKKPPTKKAAKKSTPKKTGKKAPKDTKPKAVKKAAKKTGRPLIKIDGQQVEAMCQMGCTLDEVGSVLGCSRDTLERRFAARISKGRLGGKVRLRKAQMNAAMSGNITMLIWLGKNILGQSDKIDQQLSGPDGGPIQQETSGKVTLNLTMNAPAEDPWEQGEDTEGVQSKETPE